MCNLTDVFHQHVRVLHSHGVKDKHIKLFKQTEFANPKQNDKATNEGLFILLHKRK